MYIKTGVYRIHHKFIEIFQNILNSYALLKNIEVKNKKQHKNCLTEKLRNAINEDHRVFSE